VCLGRRFVSMIPDQKTRENMGCHGIEHVERSVLEPISTYLAAFTRRRTRQSTDWVTNYQTLRFDLKGSSESYVCRCTPSKNDFMVCLPGHESSVNVKVKIVSIGGDTYARQGGTENKWMQWLLLGITKSLPYQCHLW
jgi:hypothetical protein